MNMTPADLADRYTILLIKQEHNLDVAEELAAVATEVVALAIDFSELLQINRIMWRLEELASRERDLECLGVFHLALRQMTLARTKAKNDIAYIHGGFRELKDYSV